MTKSENKQIAIEQLLDLQKAYTEYLNSIKDQKFDDDIRATLREKGNILRWIQNGLESGYYDTEV